MSARREQPQPLMADARASSKAKTAAKAAAKGGGRTTYAVALIVAVAAVLAAGAIYGSPPAVAAPAATSTERKREPEPTKVQPVAEPAPAAEETAVDAKSAAAAAPEASADPRDGHPDCAAWAANGECARNPGFMLSSCALSCAGQPFQPSQEAVFATATAAEDSPAKVDWPKPVLAPELEAAQAETKIALAAGSLPALSSRCSDARSDCAALARWNLSACGEAPFMLTQCKATCRTCAYQPLIGELTQCENKHEGCEAWASAGECDKNKRYMLSACSKACGVCGEKQFACARRNTTPGVLSPTELTDMFAAAQRDFPQYSPIFLSTDPPILQFDNLLTPKEAAAMIAVAGDKLVPSLAGDQVSPVRTSKQHWCDDADGCTSHPTIKEVTRRMVEIVQMPEVRRPIW
jgi:hypothetical protein